MICVCLFCLSTQKPLYEDFDGSQLWSSAEIILHHLHNCNALIAEEEEQRGEKYKFVRIMRSDLLWRYDHVPVSILDGSGKTCYLPL